MSDARFVPMRTSASAKDFWSRLRPDDAVGADGKVLAANSTSRPLPEDEFAKDDVDKDVLPERGLGHKLLAGRALTPYGRQTPPFGARNVPNEIKAAKVELYLFRQELEHAEAIYGSEADSLAVNFVRRGNI